jgi:hypothetical protein
MNRPQNMTVTKLLSSVVFSSKAESLPEFLIEQILAQVENKNAESLVGESGLAGQLKKRLAERMLTTEAKQGRMATIAAAAAPRLSSRRPVGWIWMPIATAWPPSSRNW